MDTTEISPESFNNAYSLLRTQMSLLEGQSSKAKRYLHRFYQYNTHSEQPQVSDRRLLIPRYIRDLASTHRLVIVNLMKFKAKNSDSVTKDYLQLSYEDVPSQCRCSPFFNASTAEIVAERELLYKAQDESLICVPIKISKKN